MLIYTQKIKTTCCSTAEGNVIAYSVFHVTETPALIFLYWILKFSCFAEHRSIAEEILTTKDETVDSDAQS